MNSDRLKLTNLRFVVLDEADSMFDLVRSEGCTRIALDSYPTPLSAFVYCVALDSYLASLSALRTFPYPYIHSHDAVESKGISR